MKRGFAAAAAALVVSFSAAAQRVQLRVIRALHDAGRKVMIGLEMFPYTEQKSLDHWRDGLLTEAGVLTDTDKQHATTASRF
jgi:uncharacterized iron-regulated protein